MEWCFKWATFKPIIWHHSIIPIGSNNQGPGRCSTGNDVLARLHWQPRIKENTYPWWVCKSGPRDKLLGELAWIWVSCVPSSHWTYESNFRIDRVNEIQSLANVSFLNLSKQLFGRIHLTPFAFPAEIINCPHMMRIWVDVDVRDQPKRGRYGLRTLTHSSLHRRWGQPNTSQK